jgi:hypothetical protein
MRNLHGIPTIADLTSTARHEAGHLLMLWLLVRYAVACGIADGCGVTKALDVSGEKETPHQRILYAMSGMVLAGEFELLSELKQHAAEPDYFDPMSDSHYIVEALPHIGGDPAVVLSQFSDVILRLGNRFRKAHNQAARLLCERGVIAFDTIHGLFCQWDVDYDLVARPKSDLVCRAVAHTFHWRMPRAPFIGWDFKPLPGGFVAPARMGLEELAERVKDRGV